MDFNTIHLYKVSLCAKLIHSRTELELASKNVTGEKKQKAQRLIDLIGETEDFVDIVFKQMEEDLWIVTGKQLSAQRYFV